MPRQVLQNLLADSQCSTYLPGHGESHDFDDYCILHANRLRSQRYRNHSSFTYGNQQQMQPQGQPMQQQQPMNNQQQQPQGNNNNNGNGGGEEKKDGQYEEPLEYRADNGKMVILNGEDEDKCIDSCKAAPELSDKAGEEAGKGSMMMNMASGGEQAMMAGCIRFCQTEFEIQCFPGSSTVSVRDRGSIPLSKLRLGDHVLVMQRRGNDTSDWVLRFEPVISWLHYEPEAEMEVVEVHHALGKVSLTPDHLLFVRRPELSSLAAIMAREVSVGDKVLSPWLDGSLAEAEVTEVCRKRATGAYCPFMPSGVLLVDSTAVSCYCVPNDIAKSPLWAPVLGVLDRAMGRQSSHDAAHALFLPVRLLHQVVSHWQAQMGEVKHEEKDIKPADKNEVIHPYGLFMYIVAKSFTV